MTDNQFDDLFRTRLEGHTSKVPDDMWERINKKDKDRRVFFIPRWYWLALLLLFISIGGYFVLNTNTANESSKKISKIENEKNKNEDKNKSQKEILDKENENKDSVATNAKDDKSYFKAAITNTSNLNKTKNKINNQQILSDNNSSISTNQNLANDDPSLKDQDDKSGVAAINKNNKLNSSINKNSIVKKFAIDSLGIADENKNDSKKDEDDNRDKFSLELFSTLPPSIAFNNIHSENKLYEQQLKDASKIRYTLSVGARFDLRLTKKISGKIGFQYTLINERIDFTYDSIMTNVSSNNFYNSFDVPILFSYTSIIKSNVKASVTSGIILNLSSTYKGLIPDPYGGTVDIKTDNVYNRNNGISIYLGIGLSKNVKPNLDVFAQPYFIYRTKSMTNNLEPFDRKINILGIEYGLRYKLFKDEQ